MYALDLTPVFDQLLKSKEGATTRKPQFNAAQTEGFLKEAYRINKHIATLSKQLGDVRQAYLSTAPPRRSHHHHHHSHNNADHSAPTSLTDAEREDIDANAKRLLRDLNASIRGLADAEALHQETQQALIRKQYAGPSFRFVGLGASPKSPEQTAAEEAQTQAAAHHESVLWYLRQRLQACGRAQQTMMEARLARMVVETTAASQQQALLVGATNPAPRGSGGVSASAAALEEEAQWRGASSYASRPGPPGRSGGNDNDGAEADLTAEQIQMFERGNQDMLKHYETTLDKVRAAEQSLVEISELQTMLVGNLEIQSAHVDQMVADSFTTAENVAKGNRELKKALDRPSTARYTFYAASGLCLFVVVWDFFV
ncbi:snare protein [Sporothrix schenckii 1099-18]|uniref:Snare protein n=1 Tax=Sporothrix schenckii 1099-18 TaxID=1397361 RepID=A0A0F2MFW3_SPOSC|nr:snare protein [Sporothrix schenckii 1099-18]KJR87944.1 snare protein [Sporothrix schenckii 1099-18]